MDRILFGLVPFLLASSSVLAQTLDSAAPLKVRHVDGATYPAIAMAARVSGEVILRVTLGANGSPESVTVDSGPQMLRQAAVDSATRSQFTVISESKTGVYHVAYRFIFNTTQKCNEERDSSYPHVNYESDSVTIEAQPYLICDPSSVRVRSAKCLFLWRCGWK